MKCTRVYGNTVFVFIGLLWAATVQGAIIITEVFPNPSTGVDEFVELYNNSESSVDLTGWKIDDDLSSGRSPKILSGTIGPNDYFVVYFASNFAYFNNTGTDSANLLDTSSQLINSVEYKKDPPKDLSYSLNSTLWGWTIPTPDSQNQTSQTNQPTAQTQQTTTTQTSIQITAQQNAPQEGQPDQLNGVILTEALPNPAGDDQALEFIELFNTNGYSINIGGWQLDDASGGSHPYIIPHGTIIAPHTYITFYSDDTKIALNNSGGDALRLVRPDASVADTTSYTDTAREGLAYAKTRHGSWGWTETPTPGAENQFETQPKAVPTSQPQPSENEANTLPKGNAVLTTKNTHPTAVTPQNTPNQDSDAVEEEHETILPPQNNLAASIINPSAPQAKQRPLIGLESAILISITAGLVSLIIRRTVGGHKT